MLNEQNYLDGWSRWNKYRSYVSMTVCDAVQSGIMEWSTDLVSAKRESVFRFGTSTSTPLNYICFLLVSLLARGPFLCLIKGKEAFWPGKGKEPFWPSKSKEPFWLAKGKELFWPSVKLCFLIGLTSLLFGSLFLANFLLLRGFISSGLILLGSQTPLPIAVALRKALIQSLRNVR